jgi:subtilisin family serine protease
MAQKHPPTLEREPVSPSAPQDQVVAVVSPRSRGPVPLFAAEGITPENVEQYRSDPDVVTASVRELQRLGFSILQVSDTTISIGGTPERFEGVFGRALVRESKSVDDGDRTMEFFQVAGASPEEQLLAPPGSLSGLLEGVALAEPPQLFESALPPLAPIGAGAYRYLFVPCEVGMLLNAARVHRLGTTGKGVNVAMVDTGQYPHPYFNRYGFAVKATTLGPGTADPAVDSDGHGTGESANVFATAPDATLWPVKMGADTTGAFNAAIALKPHVITNSWGYHVDFPGAVLTPYLKTLEAAVANAVSKGIVVCFAAGNGHLAFPACHPSVIAVGGVHVNYPGLTFEASNYASSFVSNLYPGRRVPDVCGLVGRKVGSNAPLIMLPVPPGSFSDLPNTGAANDGWGIFSGTSAACPQVAGIVALMLQKNPGITPANAKKVLLDSAVDVTAGTSSMGHPAGPGVDLATGAGLANAKWAWLITMGGVTAEFFGAEPEVQHQMLEGGRMPPVTQELIENLIDTLRSRV